MFKEYKGHKSQLKNPPTGNDRSAKAKERKFFDVFDELMSGDVRVDGIGEAETGKFKFIKFIFSFAF